MSDNWKNLKAVVSNAIKQNSNQEITGTVLQNTLNTIINTLGENATFAGIATPETSPGYYDGLVFYVALEQGTYVNFNTDCIKTNNDLFLIIYNRIVNESNSWHNIAIKNELLGEDKNKLDNLYDYAFTIVGAAIYEGSEVTFPLKSFTGSEDNIIIKPADSYNAGVMSAADKRSLDKLVEAGPKIINVEPIYETIITAHQFNTFEDSNAIIGTTTFIYGGTTYNRLELVDKNANDAITPYFAWGEFIINDGYLKNYSAGTRKILISREITPTQFEAGDIIKITTEAEITCTTEGTDMVVIGGEYVIGINKKCFPVIETPRYTFISKITVEKRGNYLKKKKYTFRNTNGVSYSMNLLDAITNGTDFLSDFSDCVKTQRLDIIDGFNKTKYHVNLTADSKLQIVNDSSEGGGFNIKDKAMTLSMSNNNGFNLHSPGKINIETEPNKPIKILSGGDIEIRNTQQGKEINIWSNSFNVFTSASNSYIKMDSVGNSNQHFATLEYFIDQHYYIRTGQDEPTSEYHAKISQNEIKLRTSENVNFLLDETNKLISAAAGDFRFVIKHELDQEVVLLSELLATIKNLQNEVEILKNKQA